ncbi:MAG: hypothetical protein U0169_01800, partial [Polyangiaceae bacterium]
MGGSNPIGNCNPTEVTLRLSFKKVVDTDYEVTEWDGNRQDAFGWFLVERYGYDRNYGPTDDRLHRFAAKYNIWEKSHTEGTQCNIDAWRDAADQVIKYKTNADGAFLTDPTTGLPIVAAANDPSGKPFTKSKIGLEAKRDDDGNGTEDECEFFNKNQELQNPGSRCDTFSHKCTIPTYARKIKTIPWYYAPGSAPDLFASTAEALQQWNLAMKNAAQIGKKVEADRVGLDGSVFMTGEDALKADNGKTVPNIFVLCHSPVIAGDDAACGPAGLTARTGDIRYNFVNMIDKPQTPSPWGIMVDADDPLTGEKISTSVNEWAHVLDLAVQGTMDVMRWANGEIKEDEIVDGRYMKDWLQASRQDTAQFRAPILDQKEIESRLASIDYSMQKLNGLTEQDKSLPAPLRELKAQRNLAKALGPSLDPQFEATRKSLIGTKWETMMITPELVQRAGMDPRTPIAGNDALIEKASPLRGQNPGLRQWTRRMKDSALAKNGACMVEQPEPTSLLGLARLADKLYPRIDQNDPDYAGKNVARSKQIHQWLREQFHLSVILHEMGHSMGLRHNFTGSEDSLNYDIRYWQLRTRNGKEHFCGLKGDPKKPAAVLDAVTPHTDGHDCVGPRWVDPITEEEVNGMLWRFASTTVMDYAGDQTQDMNGLGPYDRAAVRFGYADVVDVETDAILDLKRGAKFDTNSSLRASDKGTAYAVSLDDFGGIVGRFYGRQHYSTYADKFGILGECTEETEPGNPLSATCSGPKLDYVAMRDMQPFDVFGAEVSKVLPYWQRNWAVDKQGRVRHPYEFASDEYADTGNIHVFRFDAGADAYETFQFLISTYENRYIFDNFRRNRATFNSASVSGRTQDRYFSKVQGMTKSLALAVGRATDDASTKDPGEYMPLALGASDGFAMFARVLTRPEPGYYKYAGGGTADLKYAKADSFNVLDANYDFTVSAGSGEGRYLHNDYDYSKGYFWSSYQTQVGSFYEKIGAIYFLTEA